ncbi:hypothetical protein HPB49_011233 [Dermacentor silvarum]|uniref:Uncharacterized protein n=1 Tax=Dermacentor silvarum TaxID=543639 RepID=A0ACB8C370_DERSI|nr:hypothetical protein HPB49_011233 [Dermacentor silvarum]
MRNPYIKAYLFFIRFSLKSITVFNALFQSEKVLVHTLHHESDKPIKKFLLNFVTAKQLQRKGCNINENDSGTYVPLEQVYIGSAGGLSCPFPCVVNSSPCAWLHCASSRLADHEAGCPWPYHVSLLLTSRPAAPGPSTMTDCRLGGPNPSSLASCCLGCR